MEFKDFSRTTIQGLFKTVRAPLTLIIHELGLEDKGNSESTKVKKI